MSDRDSEDYWVGSAGNIVQPDARPLHEVRRHPGNRVPELIRQMTDPLWIVADGAVLAGLMERLETSDLENHCLVPRHGYEELTGVAPWLIRLDPQDGLCAQMMSDSAGSHWAIWSCGLVLSSTAPGQDLARHLRQLFMRVNANGSRVFHRFWEPSSVFDYFTALQHLPDRAASVFQPGSGVISAILAREVARDRTIHVVCAPPSAAPAAQFRPPLDPPEVAALLAAVLRPFAVEMARDLARTDPAIVGHLGDPDLEDIVTQSCVRLHGYGFRDVALMRELALQDIWSGGPFEAHDPQLRDLCLSDRDEQAKYAGLSQHIASLV